MSVQSSSPADVVQARLLALLERQPDFQPIRSHLPGICRSIVQIACGGVATDDNTADNLLIPTALFLQQLLMFQQDETVGQQQPVREALVQAIMRDKPDWPIENIRDLQELVDTVLRKAGDLGYSFARQQDVTLADVEALERS